jgi:hypothetical protein
MRVFLFVSVMLTGLAMAAGKSENLVPNAGFDQGKGDAPEGWSPPDGLTLFWENGGVKGKCIRINTDVLRSEWSKNLEKPGSVTESSKTPPTGEKYDTVGGTVGIHCWSGPVAVEAGQWYLMEADIKGVGGSTPHVFLRGFQKVKPGEESGYGVKNFMRGIPGGEEFTDPALSDYKRNPKAGDNIQCFRATMFCRLPGDADKQWYHFVRPVQIPTREAIRAEVILLCPYAYWPCGNYFFDNVTLRKITEDEAKKFKLQQAGVPVKGGHK